MALLILMAVIDIISGILLAGSGLPYLPGNGFVVTMAAIALLKGGWFTINWQAQGRKSSWDILEGLAGLLGGLLLTLVYLGISHGLFGIPGVLLIVIGSWRLFQGLIE